MSDVSLIAPTPVRTPSIELSPHSIKQAHLASRSKILLGDLCRRIYAKRYRQLYRHPTASPNTLVDRAMTCYLKKRCLTENRSRYFARLHQEFWSGKNGAKFSENCDHRFDDLFLQKQRPDFEALTAAWLSIGSLSQIVEIGCCSGRLLEFLTQKLPNVTHSFGIDINETQILANTKSNDFDSRIQFFAGDGIDWLMKNGNANTLFVTNGGVLEYFTRDSLCRLLAHIHENCRPAVFFISEPVAADHDLKNNNESVPFGEELSFSHNYIPLFEENGFKICHQRSVIFDEWKMLAAISIAQ